MANRDETPFARQPRTILAALVGVVILLVVAWLIFAPDGQSQRTADPAPRTTPSRPSATPSHSAGASVSAYESACGLHGGRVGPAVAAPSDVSWRVAQGWVLPVSKSQGPGRVSQSGPWSCFAHTPTGAVLAAYLIPIRLGIAPHYVPVIKQQTVPGVGQQALLSQGKPDAAAASPLTPKGFVVNSYTGSDATVSVVVSSPPQGVVTCSVNVQWFGGASGDWRVRLEPDGSSWAGCVQSAPTSYVRWGPKS